MATAMREVPIGVGVDDARRESGARARAMMPWTVDGGASNALKGVKEGARAQAMMPGTVEGGASSAVKGV